MNVGLICPGPEDCTSFYRGWGVFAYLSRETGIRLITHDEWAWPQIVECDLIVLQRPCLMEHVQVMSAAKALNVPTWVDMDDDVFCIPLSNPAHSGYSPATLDCVRRCVELADVLTVATEPLRHARRDSEVIPNALNTYVWPFDTRPRTKTITWRGSKTHWADMEPFLPAMRNIAREFPDWRFVFLGHPHWRFEGLGEIIPQTTPFHMMDHLKRLAPTIHVVPLQECQFNRNKSNCAWLEATAAGAMVIGPNWPEWHKPGIVRYESPESFEQLLREAIVSDGCEDWVNQSRRFIHDNLTLPIVNRQRIEILRRFCPTPDPAPCQEPQPIQST